MQVKELNKYNISELEDIIILSKLMKDDIKCIFNVKPFINMEYGEVLQLKNLIISSNSIDPELIQKVSELCKEKITIFDIENSTIKDFFATINRIEFNFKEIHRYESMLTSGVDSDLESAGISDLNQFGDLNVIDTLAGGDILKWESVLKLQWWDVFNKLLKDKKERDIQKRYAQIQQNKSK